MNNLQLERDHPANLPLFRQIYEQLRQQILTGLLATGARLPASRQLASQLEVARVTVDQAYAQLQAEGYVVSRVGAGTFVSQDLQLPAGGEPFRPVLSDWGQRIIAVETAASTRAESGSGRPAIDFGFGRSFPHIFPYDIWRRLLARYLSTDDTMLSRYGSTAGFYPLRQAVARYLNRLREVRCSAEQVVIVNGMQQALDILTRLLLNPGDEVLVESPGYADAFHLFAAAGAQLTALQVDEEGFPVGQIPAESQARLAFVTPSNQFPQGGTMPLPRRLALLDWARRARALILEDDYDGELRYDSSPLAALQGLDPDGRVIYLGTFSKVLFPALRLGYVVLPPALLPPFLKAQQLVDRGAPTLTQAAVADFINEGHFERHLRRLRQEYGRRRQLLIEALERYLPPAVHFSRVEAGLHVMLYLPAGYEEASFIRRAAEIGVGLYPGRPYHLRLPARPSVLLGFSGLSDDQIQEGVSRLGTLFGQ